MNDSSLRAPRSGAKQSNGIASAAFGVLAMTWCVVSTSAQADQKPGLTEKFLSSSRSLYERQCAVCHGVSGRGDGPAAYLLYPKPRDFTRGEYRLVSTQKMEATDEDLFRTITRGMPGSSMPSWETLSEEERWGLVYYLRYLEEVGEELAGGRLKPGEVEQGLPWPQVERLVNVHAHESSMPVSEEPGVTPQILERGKNLFAQACAACHGPEGKGDGKTVMKDSSGVEIRPRDLTAGMFKGYSEGRDLFYRIRAGLPGSPMPSYALVYKDEDIWALVHYVKSLAPAGAGEKARVRPVSISAQRVEGELATDPASGVWEQGEPVYVVLTPLWWRDQRIEGVEVRALHNGSGLALLLQWTDATQNASAVKVQDFSDGAAVQWSFKSDPPFFGMGSAGDPVAIWHWKASWESETVGWKDIETEYPNTATDFYEAQKTYTYGSPFETSASETRHHDPETLTAWGSGNPLSNPAIARGSEVAAAEGLGTLTRKEEGADTLKARAVWSGGKWALVFHKSFEGDPSGSQALSPGERVKVAFALWDGSQNDRNGQKAVSVWNDLVLEK